MRACVEKVDVLGWKKSPPITDSMIPVDFFQFFSIMNFTTDDMTSKFGLFSENKIIALYLTESMKTRWPRILDEHWKEIDAPYSDGFGFWPDWMFQYFNELPLCESIESAYLVWKSEQHRLTSKHDIMCSLVTPVNQYFVTMEEDGNQFKITCQHCNDFVTCSGSSVDLLYITFLHSGISTLGLYPEDIISEILCFQWPSETKMQSLYQNILEKGNGYQKCSRWPDLLENNFAVLRSATAFNKADLEGVETVKAKHTLNDSGFIT